MKKNINKKYAELLIKAQNATKRDEAIFLLRDKDLLSEQKINLLKIRGKKGAIKKLSNLILETIAN